MGSRSISFSDLKWDGSYLGLWNSIRIRQSYKEKDRTYHQIEIDGKLIIVQSVRYPTPYACLVDEIKPYFGLPKQGTHWLKSGNLAQIIIRTNGKVVDIKKTKRKPPNSIIRSYPTLTEFKKLYLGGNIYHQGKVKNSIQENFPQLAKRIKITFAYRLIFGIKKTNQSSLLIRWANSNITESRKNIPSSWLKPNHLKWIWYPTSINEGKPCEPGVNCQLPNSILDEWFGEEEIDDIVKEMCRIREYNQIAYFILMTQNHIESAIQRIDRHLIIHVKDIIQRLTVRLSSDLRLI